MQEQVQELVEAEVHFVSSFYSIAAMDGQTAEHLQKIICRYSKDEILTVMWVSTNSRPFGWFLNFVVLVFEGGGWWMKLH